MIRRAPANVSLLLNVVLAGGSGLLTAGCAGITVAPLPEAPPAGYAAAMTANLAPGLRVLRGGSPYMDFWFRGDIPTVDPKPAERVRYGAVKPGALVGIARVHQVAVDFRAQKVRPGLYTLRYGVQPDDGDHEDKTEARDFLLLCPAADDVSPAPLEHKPLTKLSATLNGKKHPAVLFLDAPGDGPLPGISTRPDPDRILLEAPAGKSLRLAIVVVGQYME